MANNQVILGLIEQAAKQASRELDLRGSQLTSLPPEIASLTKLVRLDLRGIQLKSLPREIGQLTNLTGLYLGENQLTKLPPEIWNLTNLTNLHLDSNQLTSLPPEIGKLTNLMRLYLNGNQLSSLPLEIGKLTKLTRLEVSANQLISLPPTITYLTKLVRLDLDHNQLTSLPPEITKLTNLGYVTLWDNRLPIPPETLGRAEDVKAIFAAVVGLKSGVQLNEAKMLVLGDGKVGKSSIVAQLTRGTFDPKKETTLGVEINDEMKIVQSKVKGEGEPVKLNIWDFGGQEIQHSTHQFFLTTRSLYLLVVDARKGDQISNIEYWLKLIKSFGGDSPIIIVINQIDQLKGQRPLNVDRKTLQEKYNIGEFVETSCETGEGIGDLKAAIARQVEGLRHVRDVWPREWVAIKRRLQSMKSDYIPLETYLEICGEENLNDAHLRHSLLDVLHVLGTVVRFSGDTEVLHPRWVTQGVYGLLTSAQLVKDQGQLDLKDVGHLLSGLPDAANRYSSHTHRRLIEVMKHFDLCFEFTDRPGHYLIPRHLHDDELDIPWDDSDGLKFQYQYETLPDAVISRFIVRMNRYITKQYYWKNGVFLQDGENRAKIKADLVDRKISISIIGPAKTRRDFLAVIRSVFDEINGNFKIKIEQMIPLPDEQKEFVSYDALLIYENKNKQTIFVHQVGKDYDVRTLLDDVEEWRMRQQRRYRDLGEESTSQIQPTSLRNPSPTKNNPLVSLISFAVVFAVLLAALVATAVVITKWVVATAVLMTGVIIIGALLAMGVLGAMQLRNDDRLSEDSFLKLMVESYKRLPLLKGTAQANNQLDE